MSVAGSVTANVLPEAADSHFPSISPLVRRSPVSTSVARNDALAFGVRAAIFQVRVERCRVIIIVAAFVCACGAFLLPTGRNVGISTKKKNCGGTVGLTTPFRRLRSLETLLLQPWPTNWKQGNRAASFAGPGPYSSSRPPLKYVRYPRNVIGRHQDRDFLRYGPSNRGEFPRPLRKVGRLVGPATALYAGMRALVYSSILLYLQPS